MLLCVQYRLLALCPLDLFLQSLLSLPGGICHKVLSFQVQANHQLQEISVGPRKSTAQGQGKKDFLYSLKYYFGTLYGHHDYLHYSLGQLTKKSIRK